MKKKISKTKIGAAVLIVAGCFSVALAQPGGTDDPLISKSYIDTVLMPQIKEFVETKISQIGSSGGEHSAESFTVVSVDEGKSLICQAGTELILRMGSAEIIATEKGGLADTTAGYDLSNGSQMPSNHLLIVPVADGRGIKAKTNVLVMVKGGYSLE